jgi:hypothetical protein
MTQPTTLARTPYNNTERENEFPNISKKTSFAICSEIIKRQVFGRNNGLLSFVMTLTAQTTACQTSLLVLLRMYSLPR